MRFHGILVGVLIIAAALVSDVDSMLLLELSDLLSLLSHGLRISTFLALFASDSRTLSGLTVSVVVETYGFDVDRDVIVYKLLFKAR